MMMQNIADVILEKNNFIIYNHRRKTISAIKKRHQANLAMLETDIGCAYDFFAEAASLLKEHCSSTTPSMPSANEFIEKGPSFWFTYHPCLGPFYEIIAQKIPLPSPSTSFCFGFTN